MFGDFSATDHASMTGHGSAEVVEPSCLLWGPLRTIRAQVEPGADVRRMALAGTVALVGGLGLAGCSGSSQSYGDGYSVGQSLAASAQGFSAPAHVIAARCERQWRVSGSDIDNQRQWVSGCRQGFLQVEAEVTSTSHT